jgi:hypothetical protein
MLISRREKEIGLRRQFENLLPDNGREGYRVPFAPLAIPTIEIV